VGGGPIVLAAVIVAAGLIGYGLLTRPAASPEPASPALGGSGSAAGVSPVASAVASAPIIGLTIQSPADGEQVSTKEVTVIGLAPPGMKITRDISFFPDQHATADSTGHWAIAVSLNEGNNDLVFRIGDDRSSDQRIRITYTPAAQ
jgi:hypothetical protein